MKPILYILTLILSSTLTAQSDAENVKSTIDSFFESFHAQDTVGMKDLVSENVVIQSIGEDQQGKTLVHETSISDFLKGIVSIPKNASFKEELLDYQISIDGNMALIRYIVLIHCLFHCHSCQLIFQITSTYLN